MQGHGTKLLSSDEEFWMWLLENGQKSSPEKSEVGKGGAMGVDCDESNGLETLYKRLAL